MSKKEEIISINLESADFWMQKEDIDRETRLGQVLNYYLSALLNQISLAVTEIEGKENGISYLNSSFVMDVLVKVLSTGETLEVEMRNKKNKISLGGAYNLICIVQLCWLLKSKDLASRALNLLKKDIQINRQTKYWETYSKTLVDLVENKKNISEDILFKGQEKYWWNYLLLLSKISQNADLKDILRRISDDFDKRNIDKKIKDDNYEIDGSGWCKANWNFRLESLLFYKNLQ